MFTKLVIVLATCEIFAHGNQFRRGSRKRHRERVFEPDVSIEERIIGGEIAGPYKIIPYQLHISSRGEVECGAVLLDVYAIHVALTATHCLWSGYPTLQSLRNPRRLSVTAGNKNLSHYPDQNAQQLGVKKMVAHPDYDPGVWKHDIALMFLEENYEETEYVQPIRLPEHNWDLPPKVEVSGWGSQIYGKDPQDALRFVVLPVIRQDICLGFDALPWTEVTDNQFCAGVLGGHYKQGSCSGDSGGPATYFNHTAGYLYVAGIVSFGITLICGNPFFPTVYTRISKYVDWIKIEVSKYKEENGL